LRWPCDTLSPQKLALTSPRSGDHSVRIVRSWTKAMELLVIIHIIKFSIYLSSKMFVI
jgi:hypothetical protein